MSSPPSNDPSLTPSALPILPDADADADADLREEDPTFFHSSDDESESLPDNLDPERAKFTDGLVELLAPIVKEIDTRVVAVKQSQVDLNKEIERLSAELQLFLNNTEPPTLQPAIIKLANTRRRLTNATTTLKNVYDRIERLHLQLSKKAASAADS